MQFSHAWLRAVVDPPMDTNTLCHHLTMAGLEVESMQEMGADSTITLKLTPNRADCLSIKGIAREVAAITHTPLTWTAATEIKPLITDAPVVRVSTPAACPRYCARLVRGVGAHAPSPSWMTTRLLACGLRPVSALVDITNYVMLECGQPLHAFDAQAIEGSLCVRSALAGETLRLLNGQEYSLKDTMTLIADDAKPLALAGIMGGEHSGITLETTDLLLESAFFSPQAIIGRARSLGLSTDAAHRFERGVDFSIQRMAIERATALIMELCGGQPGPITEVLDRDHLPERRPIVLRPGRVERILGIDIANAHIRESLQQIGCVCETVFNADELQVLPPPWRFDLALEIDLIEECARLVGYDEIPQRPPLASLRMKAQPETLRSSHDLRCRMAGRGFFEVITYSFVDPAWERDFCANHDPVLLANPMAPSLSVMRSSLIGGLINVLLTNRNRQQNRCCVFEIGRCFERQASLCDTDAQAPGSIVQTSRLGALMSGPVWSEQWGTNAREADIFDLKAQIEALWHPRTPSFVPAVHPAFHPGRSARIEINTLEDGRSQPVGWLGQLHPHWVQHYGLKEAPVLFEIDLNALWGQTLAAYSEISRLPSVQRDIALLVPHKVLCADLLAVLNTAAHALNPPIVREVRLFDLYAGKGLPEDVKSLAFRVVMQDTVRTLADSECDAALKALVDAAAHAFGARLRT
jgi:phenylalanyl-tRNA synthetase beta chain